MASEMMKLPSAELSTFASRWAWIQRAICRRIKFKIMNIQPGIAKVCEPLIPVLRFSFKPSEMGCCEGAGGDDSIVMLTSDLFMGGFVGSRIPKDSEIRMIRSVLARSDSRRDAFVGSMISP
jgi:hypothetical protein